MKLTLVIPTYNEKENLRSLISKLLEQFKKNNIDGEIIIVDDNSPDGTGKIAEQIKKKQKNLKVIHREGKKGLSSAVLEGWKKGQGEILGVMDADLSHPCEKISDLFGPIEKGDADFVIGSRYVKNGGIKGWGIYRTIVSRIATLLARPFTKIRDPLSGFFMIKRECLIGRDINPKGFKILLELIIKADYKHVREIPILFNNRKKGKSKAGIKEMIYYISNLIRYAFYKLKIKK